MTSPSEDANIPAVKLEDFKKIEDIPLTLSAELDRRRVSVRELLELGPDSLLTLSRATGENIDIYVGEVLLASAEILVVDARLAVRIADLRDKGASSTVKRHDPFDDSLYED
jgi:flagellar motor switch protein FliN